MLDMVPRQLFPNGVKWIETGNKLRRSESRRMDDRLKVEEDKFQSQGFLESSVGRMHILLQTHLFEGWYVM